MIVGERLDFLFVTHQETPLRWLQQFCAQHRPGRIGILTTHGLLPMERELVGSLASEVRTWAFADLLSDAEMANCDASATASELTRNDSRGHRRYFSHFMAASCNQKNKMVRDKMLVQHSPRRILFSEGLGIHPHPWLEAGGEPIPAPPQAIPRSGLMTKLLHDFRQEIHLLAPVSRAVSDATPAVVLGSVARLDFADDVVATRIQLPAPWRLLPPLLQGSLLHAVVRARSGAWSLPNDYLLCTTVHQYNLTMSVLATRLDKKLLIILDGHHPSNYSSSYIDAYGAGSFVAANGTSALWFSRHGRETRQRLWFQRPIRFTPCTSGQVSRVMLVLNHAGDWTALVNRSDTDRLIAGFTELAAKHPRKEFIIRLHPTMTRPEHEGWRSMDRIRAFVSGQNLGNLTVSDASLTEDLQRGDLYVSEYSQVLIDAWANGKLGLAVAPSGRRSFMADYAAFGFPSVTGMQDMHRWFKDLDHRLHEIIAMQNKAVEHFNASQTSWEEKPILVGSK